MSEDAAAMSELEQAAVAARALQDAGDGEPVAKKFKGGDMDEIKSILVTINKAISLRLDAIESRLDNVTKTCEMLEVRVNTLGTTVKEQVEAYSNRLSNGNDKKQPDGMHAQDMQKSNDGGASGSDSEMRANEQIDDSVEHSQDAYNYIGRGAVTLITLNSYEDYPDGSWMGDESNIEMRVRCQITPKELLHINTAHKTPEKMALSLLDALFDREIQAISNISGTGKHNKKQLDPLMVYGIRCHLIHHFNINEIDWYRIKQNLDSKCRSAHRRKVRGQNISPGKGPLHSFGAGSQSDESQDYPGELSIQQEGEGEDQSAMALVTMPSGEQVQVMPSQIHVLHATPEQIAQMQQEGQLVLDADGNHIIQQLGLHDGALIEASDLVADTDVTELPGDAHVAFSADGEPLVCEEDDPGATLQKEQEEGVFQAGEEEEQVVESEAAYVEDTDET
ncbi:PREDICTED: protein BANP-like [Priapulus caudatus]|uniref:Protein BANP n=1 Tax=Priapulus caudatus TaxID=37621 RepID=A0ABM1EQM4_PRICU|nr:PREDICTED: protein BANP-like [Priapulus caudatus]